MLHKLVFGNHLTKLLCSHKIIVNAVYLSLARLSCRKAHTESKQVFVLQCYVLHECSFADTRRTNDHHWLEHGIINFCICLSRASTNRIIFPDLFLQISQLFMFKLKSLKLQMVNLNMAQNGVLNH